MNKLVDTSLQLKNVTIGYQGLNEKKLIKNISLTATPGNLIALIGVNGSGKSTLIRTLMRLQRTMAGEIEIFGKNLKSYTIAEMAKKISYVSTENITIQNMSVFNLVALGRFPYTNWLGKLNSYDVAIINQSLQMVGMQNFTAKNINEISDGEKQRVLIARALAQDTKIILLDEPSAFLDLANKFEIIHLLQKLAKEKQKTIIYSTHDLNIAIQESDIFWIIENKKIKSGVPEDLILDNEFSKIFAHTKLNFNQLTGEFAILKSKKEAIVIKGSGVNYFWTKKALERSGFDVQSENKKNSPFIIVTENEWVYTHPAKNIKMQFKSISALLKYLDVN